MENKKSKFDLPMTYSGLLDDVVYRHKITEEVDADFFNRSILRNIFFSGRIYLNDGYLVNHPSSLQQLFNEDSVLRMMVRQNFIKVLVRQPDPDSFARNPERMAEKGILTFQRLVDRTDWPEMRRKLYHWADGLYQYDMLEPWPDFQIHNGFKKLFSRIFDKELEDLGLTGFGDQNLAIFEARYVEHPANENGPRTAAEEAVLSMESEGKITSNDVKRLMNIANQCYHYNFAMCLTKASGKTVIADTTIGSAFEDILNFDQSVEAEIANMPVVSIPRGFPVNDGSIFGTMLDPGSDLNGAKHDFLQSIDLVFGSETQRSAKDIIDDVNSASERYQSYLVEHFADRVGIKDWAPKTNAIINFGLGKIGGAFGADNAMLAANLATSGRASSFIHKLTRPIRKRALEVAFNPDAGLRDDFIFRVGEIRPRFASLAFNSDAVADHTSDIPRIVA